MTPAEESYAAAWLSEMWKPTREYHQTDGERVAAWRRQQAVNGAGDERDESSQNVAAQVRKGHLTCDNGSTKDGPGGACDANPVLTPDAAEAPVNHALQPPACQQMPA